MHFHIFLDEKERKKINDICGFRKKKENNSGEKAKKKKKNPEEKKKYFRKTKLSAQFNIFKIFFVFPIWLPFTSFFL